MGMNFVLLFLLFVFSFILIGDEDLPVWLRCLEESPLARGNQAM